MQHKTEPSQTCEHEGLLDEIVTGYLRAVGAGETPNRHELLARHPELAAELNEFFADQDRLTQLAAPLRRAAQAARLDGPLNVLTDGLAPGLLGDFRLLREVGRGGMGIVYEAEQVSLGRRVALKVLPLAATMDPRHLQRFHNEAPAAASLEHGHIVPVHGVGCERGVHYYAMKFIDGRTLAEWIAQRRAGAAAPGAAAPTTACSPAPEAAVATQPVAEGQTSGAALDAAYCRQVAQWGVQAAEALEHAHALGIVHRDIKPGNLMVDGQGKVWVTDFGLARTSVETGLTMTGDVVGTLRYMSPEQALAKHGLVDHRTDVYSLGATLYELLTLRPVFASRDRQELLKQVAFEEPVAPRKVDRAIPAELETIVLKALEKNSADRYATAQELADDLGRFLDDRPIKARRPSLRQVAVKWARRHKPTVAAAVVVLLVVLLAGGASLWWTQAQQVAREQAAGADLQEAEIFQQQERWSEALLAIERAEGRLSGTRPEYLWSKIERLRREVSIVSRLQEASLTASTVSDGLLDFAGSDSAYSAVWADLGIDLTALAPETAAEFIRTSALRARLIAALDHWAYVKDQLRAGSGGPLRAVARLTDDDPWRQHLRDPKVRVDRKALKELAAKTNVLERSAADVVLLAELLIRAKEVTTGLQLLRRAQQQHPDDFWTNYWLAYHLWIGEGIDPRDSAGFFRAALALRPKSPAVCINLATALHGQGNLAEAEAACRRAIDLKPDYAEAYNDLGVSLKDQRKLQDAEKAFRRAIALKPELAQAQHNLGVICASRGDTVAAEISYRKAIALKPAAVWAYLSLGTFLHQQKRSADAEKVFRQALTYQHSASAARHLQSVLRGTKDRNQKGFWADIHHGLGICLLEQKKCQGAEQEFTKALALKPDEIGFFMSLGLALRDQGKLDAAIASYQKVIKLKPDFPEVYTDLGIVLGMQGEAEQGKGCLPQRNRAQP
jgi:serine/threonine protein kinase/Flp pilus assembly protein TadD